MRFLTCSPVCVRSEAGRKDPLRELSFFPDPMSIRLRCRELAYRAIVSEHLVALVSSEGGCWPLSRQFGLTSPTRVTVVLNSSDFRVRLQVLTV